MSKVQLSLILPLLCSILPSCLEDTSTACLISHITRVAGAEVGLNSSSYTGDELAQSFYPSAALTDVSTVSLKLSKTGSFDSDDYIEMSIQTDSSGPSGTNIATTTTEVTLISRSTSGGWVQFTFDPVFSLSLSTLYWIRLTPTYIKSDANHVKWHASDTDDEFTTGKAMYDSGNDVFSTDLIGIKKDFNFRIGC